MTDQEERIAMAHQSARQAYKLGWYQGRHGMGTIEQGLDSFDRWWQIMMEAERIGYEACWYASHDGHCRRPKGHEGDHAYS